MTSAFLLINCDFPFAGEVTSQLAKVPEIVDIHRLHGMYDIIARVKSDTEEDLNEIVKVRVRKIDKIKSTLTMIIVEQNKIEDRKSWNYGHPADKNIDTIQDNMMLLLWSSEKITQ